MLDAAGLESLGQLDGGIEEEGLGAVGVLGGDGGFEIDEAEVGAVEDVGDVGEEGGPALLGVSGGLGGGADRLVGDDVAGDGKGDLGEIVGIRSNDGGEAAAVEGH